MARSLFPTLNSTSNFFLIAGPCVVESASNCLEIAERIKEITEKLQIPYVFKASYEKANRTSLDSFTTIGREKALNVIAKTGQQLSLPTITDIHTPDQAALAAQYVDALQIPAFLFRQTALLQAAGETGKVVNIKKGQFAGADAMQYAAKKVAATGNNNILLTERGNSFGYSDLVVDFRNIPKMSTTGYPIVMDVTHSLQKPNNSSGVTGGDPEMIETIAKAAIAVGANGLFIETHPNPSKALSDGANMLPLDQLEALLVKLVNLKKAL